MARRFLIAEERIGLAAAIALHAALVALILWHPVHAPIIAAPERMTVTIADETGLTETSPEPAALPAPDIAPELGEPPPPQPEAIVPHPAPVRTPPPAIVPKPAPRPAVQRTATPQPPMPNPPRAAPQPVRVSATSRATATTTPGTRPVGASRLGSDFLRGVPAAPASGAARNPPAATMGPAVRRRKAGNR